MRNFVLVIDMLFECDDCPGYLYPRSLDTNGVESFFSMACFSGGGT
jgi:hypothetical protein